jgi:hypothetical protein
LGALACAKSCGACWAWDVVAAAYHVAPSAIGSIGTSIDLATVGEFVVVAINKTCFAGSITDACGARGIGNIVSAAGVCASTAMERVGSDEGFAAVIVLAIAIGEASLTGDGASTGKANPSTVDVTASDSTRATILFVRAEIRFATVGCDFIAVGPTWIAAFDAAYASKARGCGIG